MDERLENICMRMKVLGIELDDLKLPDLGPCELNHVDDKEIKDTGAADAERDDVPIRSGS
jgi:hypothetical protein